VLLALYNNDMSQRARLFFAVVSTSLMAYVAVGSLLSRVMGDTTYGQLSVFGEVIRLVLDAYVEPVNLERTMAGATLGLTDALDGDSAYLNAEDLKAQQAPVKDSDGDIGAVLTRRYAFLMVVSTRPGSPAEKAGLRSGDILKTIDNRHTRPLAPAVGERLLRGAPGSIVKLKVLRQGSDPLDMSVVRERIQRTPPKGRILEDGSAYVRVGEFPAKTADDARSEIESLRKSGARRMVLDLRGSGYGLPAEGVKVAELFLKGGVVTKLSGRTVPEQVISADPGRSVWDLPLAVIVDEGTAGPGEIVAAALLDSGHVAIVGERTFGRAGVQKTLPMPEGGLMITVAKYSSPKGTAIHGRGVEPTVPIEVPDEPPADGKDKVLEKALEVLKAEKAA